MKTRRIGYAVWLLLAVCLYFFENNTGTRVVLLCSLFFPFIPPLRQALFAPDESGTEEAPAVQTVKAFIRRETEEPADIRLYMPGDPVRRIHWKLSAKKDELLVRDTAAGQEIAEEDRTIAVPEKERGGKTGGFSAAVLLAGIMICALLLLLIPEARQGAQKLCNRLFAASEAVNNYAYHYFSVPDNQNVFPAALLLLSIAALLTALTAVLRSCFPAMGIMIAVTGFQVYFGLSFSPWINIPLYGVLALRMLKRPVNRRCVMACGALVLSVSVLVTLLLPGVDAATEQASETARDYLAETVGQITGTVPEEPGGEPETRRIHTRSMESGDQAAETEQEFRLVTVEEEQISMPHWVNWMRVILLLLLAVALVTVPFVPFLLLNARKKRVREIRKAFDSENVNEAIRAAFQQIVLWLETTGYGAGNLLYRDWKHQLPGDLPEGYAERFARCAADYEEAVYSDHAMPEQKRQDVLGLLKETETALWKTADRRQRFRLRYWMCLYE